MFIILLKAISIVLVSIFFTIWLIYWSVHISQNKSERCPYGWGNFTKFLKQFNKYDKWITKGWSTSLFGKGDDYYKYYIHADIIKFNGKCMILDPVSYLKFKLFMKNICKEINGIKKIKW